MITAMKNVSPRLVKLTIQTLRDLLQNLERREKIDREIATLRTLLHEWEGEESNENQPDRRRHKRGEVPRLLHDWFIDHPKVSPTIQEIANHTGLAYSSVQRILHKEEGRKWKKGRDNRWRLTEREGRGGMS